MYDMGQVNLTRKICFYLNFVGCMGIMMLMMLMMVVRSVTWISWQDVAFPLRHSGCSDHGTNQTYL